VCTALKVYGGVEIQFHSFQTLALDGGEWLTSWSAPFPTGEEPPVPLNRGWVGLKAGMNALEYKNCPSLGIETMTR